MAEAILLQFCSQFFLPYLLVFAHAVSYLDSLLPSLLLNLVADNES